MDTDAENLKLMYEATPGEWLIIYAAELTEEEAVAAMVRLFACGYLVRILFPCGKLFVEAVF